MNTSLLPLSVSTVSGCVGPMPLTAGSGEQEITRMLAQSAATSAFVDERIPPSM